MVMLIFNDIFARFHETKWFKSRTVPQPMSYLKLKPCDQKSGIYCPE
jgi:hypothetical protein